MARYKVLARVPNDLYGVLESAEPTRLATFTAEDLATAEEIARQERVKGAVAVSISTDATIQIGDVLICPADQANPYHGALLGPKRKEALRAFKAGVLSTDYAAWYGPAHGGARKVTADEIDWERSGL